MLAVCGLPSARGDVALVVPENLSAGAGLRVLPDDPLGPEPLVCLASWLAPSWEHARATRDAILEVYMVHDLVRPPAWLSLDPAERADLMRAGPSLVGGWNARLERPWSVYVMWSDGAFKVGISTDPEARLEKVQQACPLAAELLTDWEVGSHSEAARAEAAAHKILRRWHVQGEWFRAPTEAVQVVVGYRSAGAGA